MYAGDRFRYGARPRPGRLAVVRLPGRPVAAKRLASRVDDGWWVERDNPLLGVDSWQVGTVPESDVVALVLCRLWPRLGAGAVRLPGMLAVYAASQ